MGGELITYAHKNDPTGPRFKQYSKDPLPEWACEVQVEDEVDEDNFEPSETLHDFDPDMGDRY